MLRLILLLILSTPLSAAPWFMHCYDYGCKTTEEVRYDTAQWNQIRDIFAPTTSAAEEKQAIRRASFSERAAPCARG